MRTIVVGVDGSAPSVKALRWALHEARAHQARIKAIYAYDHAPSWSVYAYAESGVAVPPPEELEETGEEAQRRAESLLQGALDDARDLAEGVDVEAHAMAERRPAAALLEAANEADLVVVGSRGRGGFVGLLLGSVSQQVIQHAPCPVVVVRCEDDEDPQDSDPGRDDATGGEPAG